MDELLRLKNREYLEIKGIFNSCQLVYSTFAISSISAICYYSADLKYRFSCVLTWTLHLNLVGMGRS